MLLVKSKHPWIGTFKKIALRIDSDRDMERVARVKAMQPAQ